ncbi:MAG TPA: hypothetical protein VNB59_01535, partial [Solirubrobacterales bacterium]|nr:hypothetical protein [Solirubrobacterales bacterium]
MSEATSQEQAEVRQETEARREDDLAAAVRHELDQVLPHVVTALKRHDGVTELRRRLDVAEKRLADREQRPLVNGVRRVLGIVRRLDFDPAAK